MDDLVHRAQAFATWAHASVGQKRKYTGEDYIHHPAEVVGLVKLANHDDPMLAAAWMHDVVEDTGVTIHRIRSMFGDDVADLVEMLTDVSRPSDGNRAQRKAIDRAHTAKASPRAKTIKLADLISNTRSIVDRDPEFARVYLDEKGMLLEVLREGDHGLYMMASNLLRESAAALGKDGKRE